ncbi:phosphatidate phosphatase [Echinococcus multilocularis]|uniref:Phosphatidate phosphatase n=1 Tax=Echinococcus multilocularis TaxID=6211 RepID=A0A068Y309_ECHMU|nr:phosphatidate phosphatase [Echinococcus multilocularis]
MSGVQWFLLRILFDLIAVIPFVVVAAVVYKLEPFQRGYFSNDNSLKYPYFSSTVKNIYLFTVVPIISILIIATTELIRARNYGFLTRYKSIPLIFINLYKFLYLLAFGYAVVSMFIHIGKIVVGRLRPNFFDVCGPVAVAETAYGYISEFRCTKNDAYLIREMRLSFPSGHSAYTMFPAIFIAVYLHYRMPAIGMGSVLQAFVQTAAVTGAFYVGMTRVSDNKHHWTDVLAGMIIGALVGIFTVRYATDVREFDAAEAEEVG